MMLPWVQSCGSTASSWWQQQCQASCSSRMGWNDVAEACSCYWSALGLNTTAGLNTTQLYGLCEVDAGMQALTPHGGMGLCDCLTHSEKHCNVSQ
jgi:hypothetical protein